MTEDAHLKDLDRWLLFPVRSVGLSPGTTARMRRGGIKVIGDLVRRPESELRRTFGLGDAAVDEIGARLAEMDLGLDMRIPGWSAEDGEGGRLAALAAAGYGPAGAPPGDDGDRLRLLRLYSVRIGDLGLSTRLTKCLHDTDIRFLGSLVRMSGLQLARIPKLGAGCMDEVSAALEVVGLALETDVGDWTPEFAETLGRVSALAWGPGVSAPGAASFKEEMLSVVAQILEGEPKQHRALVTYRRLGGGARETLPRMGAEATRFGFPRDGVDPKQVGAACRAGQRHVATMAPNVRLAHWGPAVERARRAGASTERGFLDLFGYGDADFRPGEGFAVLRFAAEMFGLRFPFHIVKWSGRAMVATLDPEEVRALHARLRELVRGTGYAVTEEMCAELGVERPVIDALVGHDGRLAFLDDDGRYFWLQPRLPPRPSSHVGNPAMSCLCKLFSVVPEVTVEDILAGMGRCKGVKRGMPLDVLDAIIERSGVLSRAGGVVSRLPGKEFRHLSRQDVSLLRILHDCGGQIQRSRLRAGLREMGFTRHYSELVVGESPLLMRVRVDDGERAASLRLLPSLMGFDISVLETNRLPHLGGDGA